MKPLVKWPGGKARQAPAILNQIRAQHPDMSVLIEPFAGGGAVSLLAQEVQPRVELVWNDADPWLFNLYFAAQQQTETLVALIEQRLTDLIDGRYDYYDLRDEMNARSAPDPQVADAGAAAEFLVVLYLGFNGLVRRNKAGFWNVPKGDTYPSALGYLSDRVREFAALPNLSLFHGDFACLPGSSPKHRDCVIYADPPYTKANATSFTTYGVAQVFDEAEHVRLVEWLEDRGAEGYGVFLSDRAEGAVRFVDRPGWYLVETQEAVVSVGASADSRAKRTDMLLTYKGA